MSDTRGTITRDNFPEFKKKYKEARDKDETSFMFDGKEVLTKYAMYVIQYIEKAVDYNMTEK